MDDAERRAPAERSITEPAGQGWLVDSTGRASRATVDDLAVRIRSGMFFWLDLEGPSQADLAGVSRALGSGSEADLVAYPARRASFAATGSLIQATLPWTAITGTAASFDPSYVSLALTGSFLVTIHETPCAPLQDIRDQYQGTQKSDMTDGPGLLFLLVDVLISSYKPPLLAIDERLGRIQLDLLAGAGPQIHDELIDILGVLTNGIQELGWYADDLDNVAEIPDSLPALGSDAHLRFDRHRRRVSRMSDNAREQRVETNQALDHYASVVAGRQAQVINTLTIVATVFLPLSFLTGYFGMNFAVLTNRLEATRWQFLAFAILLPLACLGLSLLLIRGLQRRFGVSGVQHGRGQDSRSQDVHKASATIESSPQNTADGRNLPAN